MTPGRRAWIAVPLDVLRDALGLPRETNIVGVALTPDDVFDNRVTLAITGPGLAEVPDGAAAPHLAIRVRAYYRTVVEVESSRQAE